MRIENDPDFKFFKDHEGYYKPPFIVVKSSTQRLNYPYTYNGYEVVVASMIEDAIHIKYTIIKDGLSLREAVQLKLALGMMVEK